jgi:hypothetical protein
MNFWLNITMHVVVSIVLVVTGIGFGFYAGDATIGNHTPAWIQAGAVIIALFIAIYVPVHIHRAERTSDDKDRRLKKRSLALAIYPELIEMERRVAAHRTGGDAFGQLFDVPEMIDRCVLELFLLEEAGADIQQILAGVRQFNIQTEQQIHPGQQHVEAQIFIAKELVRYLKMIEANIITAKVLLAPIHDGED